jgi:hypothetical protein
VPAAASALLASPACALQSTDDTEDVEASVIRDIRSKEEDATIITSRVWVENEWNNNQDDGTTNDTTIGLRLGRQIFKNHDWGVQFELPYVRNSTASPGGHLIDQGIGDLRVTVGTALALSPTVRIGGGLELRMPTGESDVSANIWRLQEFAAVAWDATHWLTLAPKLRYYHTVGHQNGAPSQNYWELYLPATFILPHHWSLATRYELKLDRVSDHTTHSANFTIGRELPRPRLSLSASVKVPFNSLTNDYQLLFNVTMNF